MNFRAKADMFVAYPKHPLTAYRDLTMPRRDWSRFDAPACDRIDARSVCAAKFREERMEALSCAMRMTG